MNSRFAPLLYSWGQKLSHNTDSFYPSIQNIASYFYRDRTTVMKALSELLYYGWVEVVHKEAGKPVAYRFLDHEEWARNNPECCTEKDVMPWEGEGDPLGKQLHAVSGGLAKFLLGQMIGLRKTGLSDEQIATEFRVFLDRHPQQGHAWKHVYYRFHPHLKSVAMALISAPKASNSSSGVSRTSDTYQSRTSDTPCRTEATGTSRVHATQVFEVSLRGSKANVDTIPAPSSKERRPSVITRENEGRGFPPSKPSPKKELRAAGVS